MRILKAADGVFCFKILTANTNELFTQEIMSNFFSQGIIRAECCFFGMLWENYKERAQLRQVVHQNFEKMTLKSQQLPFGEVMTNNGLENGLPLPSAEVRRKSATIEPIGEIEREQLLSAENSITF